MTRNYTGHVSFPPCRIRTTEVVTTGVTGSRWGENRCRVDLINTHCYPLDVLQLARQRKVHTQFVIFVPRKWIYFESCHLFYNITIFYLLEFKFNFTAKFPNGIQKHFFRTLTSKLYYILCQIHKQRIYRILDCQYKFLIMLCCTRVTLKLHNI